MSFIRKGSCNHCGKCCMPPIMQENPCIERGEDRCKFYTDELNDQLYGHCLIYGRGNKPVKVVKDRFGNKITVEQIAWLEQNCFEYPTAEDFEAGYRPPPECGFTFEVA